MRPSDQLFLVSAADAAALPPALPPFLPASALVDLAATNMTPPAASTARNQARAAAAQSLAGALKPAHRAAAATAARRMMRRTSAAAAVHGALLRVRRDGHCGKDGARLGGASLAVGACAAALRSGAPHALQELPQVRCRGGGQRQGGVRVVLQSGVR